MSVVPQSMLDLSELTELQSGDRMTREEFHRIYEKTPRHIKAELIGGTVYVASPLRLTHGNGHLHLGMLFAAFELNTPGVQGGDNTTVILGEDSEPQPDLLLRILPEYGGQSSTSRKDYIVGSPEFVAEIAHSSHALDLNAKRDDYTRYGVREYLVVLPGQKRFHHFDLVAEKELPIEGDGIIRVRTFPGFWINSQAFFAKDYHRLMGTLQLGLDSNEHAQFVNRLAEARQSRK
ncbi:MAG TPA: Uma2 family endonuclease [Tepidisphaeraceae bacterium]|jgi:hypothetical protein